MGRANNSAAQDQSETETKVEAAPYKPVGDVVELASAKRGKVTTKVLQDDKNVWKETTEK